MSKWAISNPDDLQEMARLLASVFGDRNSVDSLQGQAALELVRDNGALFAAYNKKGEMIGGIQLIEQAVPSAREPLVRQLQPEQAYFKGFGVDRDYQGEGVGKQLLEHVIKKYGNKELLATSKVENAASLAIMLGRGFRIIGYDPSYYPGESGEGYRLICSRPTQQEKREPAGRLRPFHAREPLHKVVVFVQAGDIADSIARAQIEELLREGRLAYGVQPSHRDGYFRLFFSPAPLKHN